uniref:Uncharacterized protein n=1 Tax=Anguilla anguilla TaxID=7936 RepID=A0A0E9P6Z9_ANGAN
MCAVRQLRDPTWEMWLMEDSILLSWDAWMSSSCSTLLAKALIW